MPSAQWLTPSGGTGQGWVMQKNRSALLYFSEPQVLVKPNWAKALAEFLFNDENSMTRIDMSEYQERHTVSRLIGAPPGYVGYDEGGTINGSGAQETLFSGTAG